MQASILVSGRSTALEAEADSSAGWLKHGRGSLQQAHLGQRHEEGPHVCVQVASCREVSVHLQSQHVQ